MFLLSLAQENKRKEFDIVRKCTPGSDDKKPFGQFEPLIGATQQMKGMFICLHNGMVQHGLAGKSVKSRNPRYGAKTDQHHECSEGHISPQPSHFTNISLLCPEEYHSHTQEKGGLEYGVIDDVITGTGQSHGTLAPHIGGTSDPHDNIAHLADTGIRKELETVIGYECIKGTQKHRQYAQPDQYVTDVRDIHP